jgi:hypothetical protein
MSSDIGGSALYSQVTDWSNLLMAYRLAARHKRGKASAAGFEHQLAWSRPQDRGSSSPIVQAAFGIDSTH